MSESGYLAKAPEAFSNWSCFDPKFRDTELPQFELWTSFKNGINLIGEVVRLS